VVRLTVEKDPRAKFLGTVPFREIGTFHLNFRGHVKPLVFLKELALFIQISLDHRDR
jgi:hypothetical protein